MTNVTKLPTHRNFSEAQLRAMVNEETGCGYAAARAILVRDGATPADMKALESANDAHKNELLLAHIPHMIGPMGLGHAKALELLREWQAPDSAYTELKAARAAQLKAQRLADSAADLMDDATEEVRRAA